MEIDTTNHHAIGLIGQVVMVLKSPVRLTSMQAKQLAAWLVVMADIIALPEEPDFEEIFEAVKDA